MWHQQLKIFLNTFSYPVKYVMEKLLDGCHLNKVALKVFQEQITD